MSHAFIPSRSSLNRRTVLSGVGVTAAGALSLGYLDRALAQEATPDALADHPLVGTWAVMTTGGVVPQTHGAAGAFVGTFQLAADIEASADGQTWSGTNTAHAIVRDAGNAVIFDEVLSFDSPVTATRIGATIESVF